MVLVKILKRKDASSVIVAIVVAMAIGQALSLLSYHPTALLLGQSEQYGGEGFGGPGWKMLYAQPILALVLQLVVLEILAWITTAILSMQSVKPQKRK